MTAASRGDIGSSLQGLRGRAAGAPFVKEPALLRTYGCGCNAVCTRIVPVKRSGPAENVDAYLAGVPEDVRAALEDYEVGKGSIRFRAGRPLLAALVKKLVKARLVENENRAKK